MIDTEILQDYAGEARELLEEMDESLILLEKQGASLDLLNNIFRAVHCIKGSAEYIGLERSGTFTHGLESLLDRLRQGTVELDPSVTDFLFRAKDLISALIEEVAKESREKTDISHMMEELNRFLAERGVPPIALVGRVKSSVAEDIVGPRDTEQTQSTDVAEFASESAAINNPNTSERTVAPAGAEPVSGAQMREEIPVGDFGVADAGLDAPLNAEKPATVVADGSSTVEEEPAAGTTLDDTVPHVLDIHMYLDDLEDGVNFEEVRYSIFQTIGYVKRSLEFIGIPRAVDILKEMENILHSFEVTDERLPVESVKTLRSLLNDLHDYYSADVFPHEETAAAERGAKLPEGIPVIDNGFAKALEEIPGTQRKRWPSYESGRRSMMADVDDELLNEFDGILGLDEGLEVKARPAVPSSPSAEPPSDLLEQFESFGEETDRELLEIFISYGWEIAAKILPLIRKIKNGTAVTQDIEECAESIKSMRSSSTYMDYQKLATFLDNWYARTVAAAERIDSLEPKDLHFMEERLEEFQQFLKSIEAALKPQPAERAEPVPAEPAEPRGAAIPPATPIAEALRQREPTTVAAVGAKSTPAPPEQERPEVDFETRRVASTGIDMATPDEEKAEPSPASVTFRERLDEEISMGRDVTQESPVVRTMRVDASKVDLLLNQVGELAVNRSFVEQLSVELRAFHRSLMTAGEIGKREVLSLKNFALRVGEASVSLGRAANELQEGVMKLRMLPVGQLFNRMPRLVRDLSRRVGKEVTLRVQGGDTEVDKRIIEQIYNPLVHLIRNAVDHGIEPVETRTRIGKALEGSILLNAYSQGNQVVIDVEDDGGGIDTEAVLATAVQSGLIDPKEAKNLNMEQICDFLFVPGFSTSRKVTRTSGRGVGMDVVKRDVEKINGHVEIESKKEKGTRISIRIPLTLAIIQTLLVRSGKNVFAIPLTTVREIIQVTPKQISTIEGFEVIKFRDETIPILRMSKVFPSSGYKPVKDAGFLVLSMTATRTVGLMVEDLIGEQDVVIKPLAEHIWKSKGLAGSSILGDGTIALVLDVSDLVEGIITRMKQRASMPTRNIQTEALQDL